MQLQQKIPEECSPLNLPENYEQFVEGIDNAYPITENDYTQVSTHTSPRAVRKKQLKISCSHDNDVRYNTKVYLVMVMTLQYFRQIQIKLCTKI